MTGHPICQLDEIPDPGSRGFTLDTAEGAVDCMLVRRGDTAFAYRNSCPHTGAPLDWQPGRFLDADGELIQCALHGALFLIESGECIHGPCLGAHLESVPISNTGSSIRTIGPRARKEEPVRK